MVTRVIQKLRLFRENAIFQPSFQNNSTSSSRVPQNAPRILPIDACCAILWHCFGRLRIMIKYVSGNMKECLFWAIHVTTSN